MRYYSPLRYPGGKGKLAKYISLVLSKNDLIGGTYVEPFAGGAGVAIALLLEKNVSKIIINDKNKAIYSFWKSLLLKTDELCRLIHDTPVTVEEWKKQKEIVANSNKSGLELGFAAFFLNRTNRSGIISGGIIGGLNQTGKWKIDARYGKKALIERIKAIALEKNKIKLYNMDVFKFIEKIIPALAEKSLIYFDPPYYRKGSCLYENHFKYEDHLTLSEMIVEKVNRPWIITYDNSPKIEAIYRGFDIVKFYLSYSAANKFKGIEIMIYKDRKMFPSEFEIKKNKISINFLR